MKMKGVLSEKSIIAKLATWLGLIVVGFVLLMVGWTMSIHGNQSVAQLKTVQALQNVMVFILPSLLAAYLWAKQPMEWLHLNKGMSWQTALLVVGALVILLPGINLLSYLNQQIHLPAALAELEAQLKMMEESAGELTELFATAHNIPELLLNLFIMAVLTAFGEEICFRGTCQGLFMDGTKMAENGHLSRRTHIAIWATAIIFSAIHMQFYGFVPRMLLGALFGYLLCWTGSLYVPMLAHCTNNALAVICYYLVGKSTINPDSIENFGTGDTLWVGLLSLVLGGALVWLIYRISVRKQS